MQQGTRMLSTKMTGLGSIPTESGFGHRFTKCVSLARGGDRARSLYATPPSPPPPPRVLRDSGLGTWRQRCPLFSAWRQRRPPFLV